MFARARGARRSVEEAADDHHRCHRTRPAGRWPPTTDAAGRRGRASSAWCGSGSSSATSGPAPGSSAGCIQPVLFLFVLGYGMSGLVGTTGGFNFRQFVYPGVVAMSVVMTAMFSAMSIVWDREFGFLREMLVAPVSRIVPGAGQDRRRGHRRRRPGDDHAGAGPAGRHPPDAGAGGADDRPRAADGGGHDHLRRVRGQPHPEDGVVPGGHADAAHAHAVPVGRAVPPRRPTGMADGDHPPQPAHLRHRPASARWSSPPRTCRRPPGPASPPTSRSSGTRCRWAARWPSWWCSPSSSSCSPSAACRVPSSGPGGHGAQEQEEDHGGRRSGVHRHRGVLGHRRGHGPGPRVTRGDGGPGRPPYPTAGHGGGRRARCGGRHLRRDRPGWARSAGVRRARPLRTGRRPGQRCGPGAARTRGRDRSRRPAGRPRVERAGPPAGHAGRAGPDARPRGRVHRQRELGHRPAAVPRPGGLLGHQGRARSAVGGGPTGVGGPPHRGV